MPLVNIKTLDSGKTRSGAKQESKITGGLLLALRGAPGAVDDSALLRENHPGSGGQQGKKTGETAKAVFTAGQVGVESPETGGTGLFAVGAKIGGSQMAIGKIPGQRGAANRQTERLEFTEKTAGSGGVTGRRGGKVGFIPRGGRIDQGKVSGLPEVTKDPGYTLPILCPAGQIVGSVPGGLKGQEHVLDTGRLGSRKPAIQSALLVGQTRQGREVRVREKIPGDLQAGVGYTQGAKAGIDQRL